MILGLCCSNGTIFKLWWLQGIKDNFKFFLSLIPPRSGAYFFFGLMTSLDQWNVVEMMLCNFRVGIQEICSVSPHCLEHSWDPLPVLWESPGSPVERRAEVAPVASHEWVHFGLGHPKVSDDTMWSRRIIGQPMDSREVINSKCFKLWKFGIIYRFPNSDYLKCRK